jgi:hypothetical protein
MQVRTANRRAGGIASFALSPKLLAYAVLADRTSSSTLVMIDLVE